MIFILMIFIQIAVFAVLVLILKGVIKRHFGTASSRLDELAQDSEGHLTEAKKKVKEANAYFDETFSKAKTEGEKIRQQLIDEGLKEKQGLLDRARKEGEAITERARSSHRLLEENWSQELTEKAREVTFQILRAVLPSKVNHSLHSEWVKDALDSDFEGLSHLNVPEDVVRVEVVSATALTEAQKKTLEGKLREKIGREVEIDEKIDETLILGFRLSMGTVVIDSSLSWQLKEMLRNEKFKGNLGSSEAF
jgi:F0F1-type ATP synthase membrane subunit b/b'